LIPPWLLLLQLPKFRSATCLLLLFHLHQLHLLVQQSLCLVLRVRLRLQPLSLGVGLPVSAGRQLKAAAS
jgi:hypothetical protein